MRQQLCNLTRPLRRQPCQPVSYTHLDVYKRQLIVIILQITEKLPELSYKEHSFIYDRTAGQGYHISIIAALFKYLSLIHI